MATVAERTKSVFDALMNKDVASAVIMKGVNAVLTRAGILTQDYSNVELKRMFLAHLRQHVKSAAQEVASAEVAAALAQHQAQVDADFTSDEVGP